MKNKLSDLNNYLFEQIERINDDTLTGADLEEQLGKSKAIVDISKTILTSANISLQAVKHASEYGYGAPVGSELLGLGGDDD